MTKTSQADRLRIALFVQRSPHSGGGFEAAISTVELLARGALSPHEVLVFTPFQETSDRLAAAGLESVRFRQRGFRVLDRMSATLLGNAVFRRLRRLGFRKLGRHLDALLEEHRIDVAFFTEFGDTVLRIGDHPFIVTIWDTDHRDSPDFVEKFSNRMFERMELSIAVTLARALAIVVNSESGARRLADLYHLDPHRLVVLPFVPSLAVCRYLAGDEMPSVETVRQKYGLPEDFVFYPVFLLPQKNHLYLLEGLVELEKRHGIDLHAVFTGQEQFPGYEATVREQVRTLGLGARVQFLGLVEDNDMPALYRAARAMVMPTYSGPANLPPLEAAALGCPVVYSDLPGCREQMGDAALYCNLDDPGSLAGQLAKIMNDGSIRQSLVDAGRKLASEVSRVDYGARLKPVLDQFSYVRRRWAWPSRT